MQVENKGFFVICVIGDLVVIVNKADFVLCIF